ncbi:hypothetical protein EV359DRAFT_83311 [Lentinula novae-zelandiae]|nr:hypothetical protein EV359DRAFT_83311 [Lentinula novae-zelandiae]
MSDSKGAVLLRAFFLLLVELAFLGEHLISQLLKKGYTIRATARSTAKSQAIFPQATTAQVEILEVPTLTSDHTAALKDAEASIHSASPVHGEGITG